MKEFYMKLDRGKPLFRFLDTVGDGSGDKDAVGNYSTDTPFLIKNFNARQQIVISRVLCYIEDAGVAPTLADYGGQTALTNGLLCRVVHSNGETYDLTGGMALQSNSNWARLCYDVTIDTFPAGNSYVHARWTLSRSGWPIVLNTQDRLEFVLRDNMTGFAQHSFLVQGYVVG